MDDSGQKMDLILTVVECPPHANMLNHTKVFKQAGGRIGRADGNDWVLPDDDRILSSKHAEISFLNGQFSITDISTNGTFINDNKVPLGSGNAHVLRAGDIVVCGDYQLRVSVKTPPPEPEIPAGLGKVDFLDGGDKTTFNPSTAAKQKAATDAMAFDSWLEPSSAPAAPASETWGQGTAPVSSAQDEWSFAAADSIAVSAPVSQDPLTALDKAPAFEQTPTDWDDSDDWWKSGSQADNAPVEQQQMNIPQPVMSAPAAVSEFSEPVFQSQPAVAAAIPRAQSTVAHSLADDSQPTVTPGLATEELRQLATLLGVDDLKEDQLRSLAPEMASIINETASRLIDLLRARTAIKNELRVQHTMIQMTDNNPLKFSATATDALKVMFSGDRSAFMRPVEAVQDSFDDLSDHQVAVLKGMNAAYEAMFRHFNPESLKRFINAKEGLLGSQEGRNWVAFEKYYESLKADHETSYNKLFGEEFARSYEKQLADLKNTRALNRQR